MDDLHSFFTDSLGPADEVPAVSPADVRKVWELTSQVQESYKGQTPAMSLSVYQHACSSGANVFAVWFRASMLAILQMLPDSPLAPWTHDGEFEESVFQVAATFSMKGRSPGEAREGLPFDVSQFLAQIAESCDPQN